MGDLKSFQYILSQIDKKSIPFSSLIPTFKSTKNVGIVKLALSSYTPTNTEWMECIQNIMSNTFLSPKTSGPLVGSILEKIQSEISFDHYLYCHLSVIYIHFQDV